MASIPASIARRRIHVSCTARGGGVLIQGGDPSTSKFLNQPQILTSDGLALLKKLPSSMVFETPTDLKMLVDVAHEIESKA